MPQKIAFTFHSLIEQKKFIRGFGHWFKIIFTKAGNLRGNNKTFIDKYMPAKKTTRLKKLA